MLSCGFGGAGPGGGALLSGKLLFIGVVLGTIGALKVGAASDDVGLGVLTIGAIEEIVRAASAVRCASLVEEEAISVLATIGATAAALVATAAVVEVEPAAGGASPTLSPFFSTSIAVIVVVVVLCGAVAVVPVLGFTLAFFSAPLGTDLFAGSAFGFVVERSPRRVT